MTRKMTKKRFARIVAAYGADPARWPEGERALARGYAADADGARRLAREEALDRRLAALPDPAPASQRLRSDLVTIAAGGSTARPRFGGGAERLVAGLAAILTPRALIGEVAALALAIAAGLWLGANAGGAQAETVDLSPYVLGGAIDLLHEEGE